MLYFGEVNFFKIIQNHIKLLSDTMSWAFEIRGSV